MWRVRASDSSINAGQTSRFRQTRQLQKNEIGLDDIVFFNLAISTNITNTRNINRQDLATVPALSSMLSTSCFGFDGETLLNGSHIKDTCNSAFRSIDKMSSSSSSNLIASQTCQSNEDTRPSIHRLLRHNHRDCSRRVLSADKSIAKRLLSTCLEV